ncbi:hypothetical protein CLIB1444_03S09120 [[Candida] jaroonii]|uniref:Uncharacterized protein n=1 Tax=[Candida] jaroonii TaxID=467808 RepID=A0ACA9Y6H9_9ASCO|nr:hypothetical protein CLIB1444_03S09120 [[Candida] jaroonii]
MFRGVKNTSKNLNLISKRFNSHGHHDPHPPKESEINLFTVLGIGALGGVTYMFYKNHKNGNEPVIKTKLYNELEDENRINARSEGYKKKYQISFIKSVIRDKGGIGQNQYRKMNGEILPVSLIPTHSPNGNQFGAGIKLSELGPRKEKTQYFAPLKQ